MTMTTKALNCDGVTVNHAGPQTIEAACRFHVVWDAERTGLIWGTNAPIRQRQRACLHRPMNVLHGKSSVGLTNTADHLHAVTTRPAPAARFCQSVLSLRQ